ncbi:hypothetical protein CKAH01_10594 [Colletotrichum kahawae]|uniref:Uncharacterized protein n=1 Tax=Colletotrichum kahawae TaxID=34407 RepID=A0AAD9XX34_COLKA|nr:hypothetical protein CKAH01_10594 [Colletotrichum kahawae]
MRNRDGSDRNPSLNSVTPEYESDMEFGPVRMILRPFCPKLMPLRLTPTPITSIYHTAARAVQANGGRPWPRLAKARKTSRSVFSSTSMQFAGISQTQEQTITDWALCSLPVEVRSVSLSGCLFLVQLVNVVIIRNDVWGTLTSVFSAATHEKMDTRRHGHGGPPDGSVRQ